MSVETPGTFIVAGVGDKPAENTAQNVVLMLNVYHITITKEV